jgi:hypothetical protein
MEYNNPNILDAILYNVEGPNIGHGWNYFKLLPYTL